MPQGNFFRRLPFTAKQPVLVNFATDYDSGQQINMIGEFRELSTDDKQSSELKVTESFISLSVFRMGAADSVAEGWRISVGAQNYEIDKITPSYRKLEFLCRRVEDT